MEERKREKLFNNLLSDCIKLADHEETEAIILSRNDVDVPVYIKVNMTGWIKYSDMIKVLNKRFKELEE